jgi:hypothetical protein
MSPDRFAGSGLGAGCIDCGDSGCDPKRWGDRGEGAALKKTSSGNCQWKNSWCCQSGRIEPQYKASFRPITLLFPHDSSPCRTPVRRKVSITHILALPPQTKAARQNLAADDKKVMG